MRLIQTPDFTIFANFLVPHKSLRCLNNCPREKLRHLPVCLYFIMSFSKLNLLRSQVFFICELCSACSLKIDKEKHFHHRIFAEMRAFC
jgi:hypothetical protein